MAKRPKTQTEARKRQIMGSLASVTNRIQRLTEKFDTPDVEILDNFSTLYIKEDKHWRISGYICLHCNQLAGRTEDVAKRHLLICLVYNEDSITPLELPHEIKKGDKIVMCPYCYKQGGNIAMARWHFDKCKSKLI